MGRKQKSVPRLRDLGVSKSNQEQGSRAASSYICRTILYFTVHGWSVSGCRGSEEHTDSAWQCESLVTRNTNILIPHWA
mgnify:CR=1 FL=1